MKFLISLLVMMLYTCIHGNEITHLDVDLTGKTEDEVMRIKNINAILSALPQEINSTNDQKTIMHISSIPQEIFIEHDITFSGETPKHERDKGSLRVYDKPQYTLNLNTNYENYEYAIYSAIFIQPTESTAIQRFFLDDIYSFMWRTRPNSLKSGSTLLNKNKFSYSIHNDFYLGDNWDIYQDVIIIAYNIKLTAQISIITPVEETVNTKKPAVSREFVEKFLSTFDPVFFCTDGTAKDVVRLLPTEIKDNAVKLTWRLKADKLLYKPESYWVRFEAENGTISRDDAHAATITFNDIKVPVVLKMYVISANGKKTYKQIVSISPDGKITQISPKDE